MLGSGAASWETHGIFKDNVVKRSFNFASFVSVLAGTGVSIIEPPFTIIPKENVSGPFSGCLRFSGGILTQDYVVENVPLTMRSQCSMAGTYPIHVMMKTQSKQEYGYVT